MRTETTDLTFRSTPADALTEAVLRLRQIDPSFVYVMTASIAGSGSRDHGVPNSIRVEGYTASSRTLSARVDF